MPTFRNLLVGALLLGAPAVASAQTVIVDDFTSGSFGPMSGGFGHYDPNILPIPGSLNIRNYWNTGFFSANSEGAGSVAIDYGEFVHGPGWGPLSYGGVSFGYNSASAFDLSGFTGLQVTGSGHFTVEGGVNNMRMAIHLSGGNFGWSPKWTWATALDGTHENFVLDFSQKPADLELTQIYGITVSFYNQWVDPYYNHGPTIYNAGTYDLKDIRLLGSPVNEVPEPESLPLLGAAAAAALVVGARRRKRAETSKG
ncbi:PEP-CTERM sorting domain-containing protein [Gemmatimonas sp.]|uniref:PEP-CTERM sorting domain-containing protein n=1 Tax=Gemmatimonas sp. TaxID=1962908 RepID=UPI003DA6A75A